MGKVIASLFIFLIIFVVPGLWAFDILSEFAFMLIGTSITGLLIGWIIGLQHGRSQMLEEWREFDKKR